MFKICTNHDFSKQRLIVHDVGLHPSLLLCSPSRRCLPLHKVSVVMIFGCCHWSLLHFDDCWLCSWLESYGVVVGRGLHNVAKLGKESNNQNGNF